MKIFLILFTLVVYSSNAQDAISKTFKGKLVNAKQEGVDIEFSKKKYTILYYSGYWCSACRTISPKIQEFYKNNKDNIEIIFISRDKNEKAMMRHMKKSSMVWPALKFELAKDRKIQLVEAHRPKSIPSMVVLDNQGKLVVAGKFGKVLKKLESL